MADDLLDADSAQVINLAEYRQQKSDTPEWANDIIHCCLYAEMVKAEHDAESARIRFDCKVRGIAKWWDGPDDITDRVDANNLEWQRYRALIAHIAQLPAATRSEAQKKRYTIGNGWLRAEGDWYDQLRAGCMADDHLFPPSLKMAEKQRRKGKVCGGRHAY